jgi:hypothetical protein
VDPQLSMLTAAEAAEFRALVHDAFAKAGRPVALGPHNAHDESGNRYGLWNLASACHDAAEAGDRASWPAIIAAHVRRVTSIPDDVFEGLTAGEALSRVYARLVPTESQHVQRASYAQQVVPGLSRILAFDRPETVASISDEAAERLGGVAALWEAGLANLRALPVEHQQQATLPDGGHFVGLTGELVFTASRVLVMEDLLRQMGLPFDSRFGVVVAMPHWRTVAVRPLTGPSAAALLSIGHVARFAEMSFADERGQISPYAYWWRDGQWTQLSQAGPGGGTTVVVPGELSRVLEQLPGGSARRSRLRWRHQ